MGARVEDSDSTSQYNLRSRKVMPSLNNNQELNGKTNAESKPTDEGHCGLGKDFFSVCVLMVLYVLQGVPLGLASSIPILIQKNIKGYDQQAAFSIVTYPFSCKLLWAPLVDCLYSSRFGRRKSWLVPLQYAIGAVMLYIPHIIDQALGNSGGEVNIKVLAGWFCFLTFLAATQDIAVDGWALTMLSKRNIGWASTCNTVGQTIGYFLGYLGFLALESPSFCNIFREEPSLIGCVTMEMYMRFWGVMFILTTTFIAVFVREKDVEEDNQNEGFAQTYVNMMKILQLKNVMTYAGCIFVIKASFAPLDKLTGLKLLEAGLDKDLLVTLSALLIPLQIALPLLITKYTNSRFPLNTYVMGTLPRIFTSLLCALLVYYAFITEILGTGFLFIGLLIEVLYSIPTTMMFVSQMMFNASVSDVKMGGTYMTLLNTLINLSGTLPQTLSLWLVDRVTLSACNGAPGPVIPSCYMDTESCSAVGGTCETHVDGYFVLVCLGTITALIWQLRLSKVFHRLQNRPLETWHVGGGTPSQQL